MKLISHFYLVSMFGKHGSLTPWPVIRQLDLMPGESTSSCKRESAVEKCMDNVHIFFLQEVDGVCNL